MVPNYQLNLELITSGAVFKFKDQLILHCSKKKGEIYSISLMLHFKVWRVLTPGW